MNRSHLYHSRSGSVLNDSRVDGRNSQKSAHYKIYCVKSMQRLIFENLYEEERR